MAADASTRGARLLTPAKIRPPQLRDDLARRPRLDTALDQASTVTLVVAPAGYGKTVAVGHWVRAEHRPVAWFSIDRQDVVPARFWRHVAAAISRAQPALGQETLDAIDEWATDGFDAANVLLAEMGDAIDPLVLVLDDLHRVDDLHVLEQLAHFIERAPRGLQVVVLSRTAPGLPVPRWRAARIVVEVGQTDLELNTAEALALIERVVDEPLPADVQQKLVAIARGWPAALQLSCLALKGHADPDTFVRSSANTDRTLSEYVVAEILDGLPEHLTAAVEALCILEHIDPARCQVVAGVADGQALIEELLRRGLPLVLWDPDHRVYRFHDLFRALVLDEFVTRHGPPSPALLTLAAQAEEAAGDQAAAVRHLMAAGDYQHAFELVVQPAWEAYRNGAFASVSMWLDQFPTSFIGQDAHRIVQFAPLLALVGRLDDAERWIHAAAAMARDSDDRDLLLELALGHLVVAVGRGDTDLARAQCDELQRRIGDEHLHAETNVRVPTVMTLAELTDERLDAADRWMTAAASLPTLPERARTVGQPIRWAWSAFERGDLRTAERLTDDALFAGAADGRVAPHALAELYAVRARLAVERLQLAEGERWGELAVDLAAELGSPLHQFLAAHAVMQGVEARSGPRAALAAGLQLLDTGLLPHLRTRVELLVAELEALTDQPASAERRIATLTDSPARRLVAARIALAHGGAIDLRAQFGDVSSWPLRRQIESALLRHRARPTERLCIQRSLELGADRGFLRTYLREGSRLRESLARQIAGESRWRDSAIGAALAEDLVGADVPATRRAPVIETLSPKERAVLEHLPSHRSTIEIAQTLYISANTVRTHVKAIYRKLDVSSRTDAVQRAEELGLLGTPAH
jgi:LuxR family maltose regulon positive regulatory protein